jgi:hypothetical protein
MSGLTEESQKQTDFVDMDGVGKTTAQKTRFDCEAENLH